MGPKRNADYLHDVSCARLGRLSPKVIYQSSDTISVEYADDGLMRVSNRQEALEMIERHCGGPYRVVGGSGGVLTPSAFDEEPSEPLALTEDLATHHRIDGHKAGLA